jgi:hypothetical protein
MDYNQNTTNVTDPSSCMEELPRCYVEKVSHLDVTDSSFRDPLSLGILPKGGTA